MTKKESKAIGKVFEFAVANDINVALTWQKTTDFAIELYRGHYERSYHEIYYSDNHKNVTECVDAFFDSVDEECLL